MSHIRPHRKKVILDSISPGFSVYCPKCNSTRVVIFFDYRFSPKLRTKWRELINEKKITLENQWEKIKTENQWKSLKKDSEKPNWICKECYDGGIILEYEIDENNTNYCKKLIYDRLIRLNLVVRQYVTKPLSLLDGV